MKNLRYYKRATSQDGSSIITRKQSANEDGQELMKRLRPLMEVDKILSSKEDVSTLLVSAMMAQNWWIMLLPFKGPLFKINGP